jgi:integrase
LKGNQIRAGQIIYVKTKGKKNRAVPITEKLQAELPSSRKAQELFKPCYSAFRKQCNVPESRHLLASSRMFYTTPSLLTS